MSRLRDRIRSRRGFLAGAAKGASSAATPDSSSSVVPSTRRDRAKTPTRSWRDDASRVRSSTLHEVEFIPAAGANDADIAREIKQLTDKGVKVTLRTRFFSLDDELALRGLGARRNPLSEHPEILSATSETDSVTFVVDADAQIEDAALTKIGHELASHHGLGVPREVIIRRAARA